MRAPKLDVKQWFKGKPISDVTKGIFVVEFWATWCGPCIEAIPHVTELAKKNPDVTFIGVSVWEENTKGIPNFVAKMGEKMDYNVGWSGNNTGMSETWLKPAAQNGIPCTFVLRDGVIQWVGHPMSLEQTLGEVKSGRFNLAGSLKAFRAEAAETRKQIATNEELASIEKLRDSGAKAKAKRRLEAFLKKNPSAEAGTRLTRLLWLSEDDANGWQNAVAKLAAKNDEGSRGLLCQFAIRSVNGKKGNKAHARKAIEVALRGAPNDSENELSYASYIYGQLGEKALALDANRKLLALIPDTAENKGRRSDLEAQIRQLGG